MFVLLFFISFQVSPEKSKYTEAEEEVVAEDELFPLKKKWTRDLLSENK